MRYEERQAAIERARRGIDFTENIERGFVANAEAIDEQQRKDEDQRNLYFVQTAIEEPPRVEDALTAASCFRSSKKKMSLLIPEDKNQKLMFAPHKEIAVN